jgi:hypothetical protein
VRSEAWAATAASSRIDATSAPSGAGTPSAAAYAAVQARAVPEFAALLGGASEVVILPQRGGLGPLLAGEDPGRQPITIPR